jgi:GT2 family glycosyltransferase
VNLSIDIVIPTYEGWELTESCLRHLARQTVPHTVIVSDNASTDGTAEKVRTSFPAVRVVETGRNLGFAVACNRGVDAGTSDVVVLLNNDVDARPDFLEHLIAPLAADDRVGSVSAVLLRPDETHIDSVGLTADVTLAGFGRLEGRPSAEAASTRPVLTGPCGGAGAYRRTAWEDQGGLDESVFSYLEDLDLALRLRAAGWKAAVAAGAVGVHLGSATIGRRSAWQRQQGGFSRGYFLRRYGVLRSTAAVRTIAIEAAVILGDAVHSGDLAALHGRLAGWRAARGKPRHGRPPPEALDPGIGFRESVALRRGSYAV